jgi:hypothetical protein
MPAQWYAIERVERILSRSHADILALVTAGRLHTRTVAGEPMVTESSLEDYLASLPIAPAPDTFVKINGRVYREV